MDHASLYEMDIKEVIYLGNIVEFNSIGGEFRNYCSIKKVHCKDGDLNL